MKIFTGIVISGLLIGGGLSLMAVGDNLRAHERVQTVQRPSQPRRPVARTRPVDPPSFQHPFQASFPAVVAADDEMDCRHPRPPQPGQQLGMDEQSLCHHWMYGNQVNLLQVRIECDETPTVECRRYEEQVERDIARSYGRDAVPPASVRTQEQFNDWAFTAPEEETVGI